MTWLAARHRPIVQRLLGVALGGVFLYASVDKIAKPPEFARIVYHYHLAGPNRNIGPALPNLIAVTLPWVEAVTGSLLLAGFWRREAALVAALLLVSFLVAVGWALAKRIDIENCGCFTVGGQGRRAGLGLLGGDAVLLALALVLVSGRGPEESRA